MVETPQTLLDGDGECAEIAWLAAGHGLPDGRRRDYQLHLWRDAPARRTLAAYEHYLENCAATSRSLTTTRTIRTWTTTSACGTAMSTRS